MMFRSPTPVSKRPEGGKGFTSFLRVCLLGLLWPYATFGAGIEAAPHPKIVRYVAKLVRLHDADKSGRLESSEWSGLRRDPGISDANGDGVLTVGELAARMVEYNRIHRMRMQDQPSPKRDENPTDGRPGDSSSAAPSPGSEDAKSKNEAAEGGRPERSKSGARRDTRYYVSPKFLPMGLPEWFRSRDADGDGQLSLSEFTPSGSEFEAAEFRKLDRDGDGLVTPREMSRTGSGDAGKTRSAAGSKQ